jgi:hypothetical protein
MSWRVARQEAIEAQERRRHEEMQAKARKISELRASSSSTCDPSEASSSAASPASSSPPSPSALTSQPKPSAAPAASAPAKTANSQSSGVTPKWKLLQQERLEFDANLKKREQEAKMKKLADLGLLVKPSIGAELPEGIPNPTAVSKEVRASVVVGGDS